MRLARTYSSFVETLKVKLYSISKTMSTNKSSDRRLHCKNKQQQWIRVERAIFVVLTASLQVSSWLASYLFPLSCASPSANSTAAAAAAATVIWPFVHAWVACVQRMANYFLLYSTVQSVHWEGWRVGKGEGRQFGSLSFGRLDRFCPSLVFLLKGTTAEPERKGKAMMRKEKEESETLFLCLISSLAFTPLPLPPSLSLTLCCSSFLLLFDLWTVPFSSNVDCTAHSRLII